MAAAFGDALEPVVPVNLLAGLLGIKTRERNTGAIAGLAPAMPGVEGKQARIEFGKAACARGAGALGGEESLQEIHFYLGGFAGGMRLFVGGSQFVQRREHQHHALAEVQCGGERAAQGFFLFRRNDEVGHRQVNAVFLEAVQARPVIRGQEFAIHAQMRMAFAQRPFCKVGIETFAVHDQWREQSDALPLVLSQQPRCNGIHALRFDGHIAVRAMLGAELYVQESQEVIDLRERGHRALASAAAGALLDGDRGRDAENGVDVGLGCGLHELARIGVERFKIAPLAFCKNDVEGQGRFARARDAGDHGELVARNLDINTLEIVFARVVHGDRRGLAQCQLQGATHGGRGGVADSGCGRQERRLVFA